VELAAITFLIMRTHLGKHVSAHPAIRLWLWILAVLVFCMVVVGGATRLTDSGLSITEWHPVVGVIPPLNVGQWAAAFDMYKATAEYQLINKGMSLADFKFIYWWEWTHRFLGRLIAVALVVPLLAFGLTRRLEGRMAGNLVLLLLLGALQGALGWYMVQSGLADRTDVSQYRLAAHLVLAVAIYAAIIWTALGVGLPHRKPHSLDAWVTSGILVLIFAQIGLGGLVAGLDAGLSHRTFPLMDGHLIPDGLLAMNPWWRNFFENALTVQFTHRLMGVLLVGVIVLHAIALTRSGRDGAREISGWVAVFAVLIQMSLGIWTLLAGVPLVLGLLHQAGAMLLLTVAIIHLHLVIRAI
jgi:cytochrome c oxidase assembly protein subunit 15